MPNSRSGPIFISYARADDEEFVRNLRDDLVGQSIDVYWDVVSIQSRGRTFFLELRDAIEAADRVIAVIGPGALCSNYVRAEWEHAVLFSKSVLPVLRIGDYSLIPDEFAHFHRVDFRAQVDQGEALKELVRLLRTPVAPLAWLAGVPALPRFFTPRKHDIERLSRVAKPDDHAAVAVGPNLQTSALHGMSGVGKSVVAAAFARTANARRAYTDGIVWCAIGREPNLLAAARLVADTFQEDPSTYTDEKNALARLSRVLQSRSCLIVLDDIWDIKYVSPFRDALGPLCRLLITTRHADLAAAAGTPVSLDLLSRDDALQLLADTAGQLSSELPEEAYRVAEECGNLPLALAMAGGMARDKPDRWTNVLARLRSADLEKIKGILPNYGYDNLLRALQASVDFLEPAVRVRYFDLAVLADNTPLPEFALVTFWKTQGLDRYETEDIVDTIVNRSLATRSSSGLISLHDLQLDYLRAATPSIQTLQRQFVEAYTERAPVNLWAGLPDDNYFHEHIMWHLEQAGWHEQIHALLAAVHDDGRNAWHEAASQAGRLVNYHADLARASRLVAATTPDNVDTVDKVLLQIRYALMTASIRSSTDRISPTLLKQLMATGTWTEARVLDYSLQRPSADRRARSLQAVTELLSSRGRQQVLAMARELSANDGSTALMLITALAECEAPELSRQSFAVAQTIRSEVDRAAAIAATAPHLSDQSLDHVLPLLDDLSSFDNQMKVIRAIAARLSQQGMDTLLHMCQDEFDEYQRLSALQVLAPYLPAANLPPNDLFPYSDGEMVALLPFVATHVDLRYALQTACQLEKQDDRNRAVAGLVPVIARTAPDRALLWTRRIKHARYLANALAESAEQFTGSALTRALRIAEKIGVPACRAVALASLCSSLPPTLRQKALAQAVTDLGRTYGSPATESIRVDAIRSVAPKLCHFGESQSALRLIASINDKQSRAAALAAIGESLAGDSIEAALNLVWELFSDKPRAIALQGIARRLSPDRVRQLIRKLNSPASLAALAPYLDEQKLEEVLTEVETSWVYDGVPLAVDALAPFLTETASLTRAVALAAAINDRYHQVLAECRLAGQASELLHSEIVHRAFERACRILDPAMRYNALLEVAKEAPAALAEPIEQAAVALEFDFYKEPVQVALATRLYQLGFFPTALAVARRIESNLYKTEALLPAAREATGPELEQLMQIILISDDDQLRIDLLAVCFPRLTEAQSEVAFKLILGMDSEESRSAGIRTIAQYLSPDRLQDAVQSARALRPGSDRAAALAGIAPWLSTSLREPVMNDVLAALTAAIGSQSMSESSDDFEGTDDETAEAVVRLAPVVSEEELADLIRAIGTSELSGLSAVDALAGLAPYVPARLAPDLLVAIKPFTSVERGKVGGALIARLVKLSNMALAREVFDRLDVRDVTPQAWLAIALGPGINHLESDLRTRWFFWDDDDRSLVISGLPTALCDQSAGFILAESIAASPKNADVLAVLLPRLMLWSPSALLVLWSELYPKFASRDRYLVLHDIAHMAPLLCRFGPESMIHGIVAAIEEVVKSWP